jgi:hypothetical protein
LMLCWFAKKLQNSTPDHAFVLNFHDGIKASTCCTHVILFCPICVALSPDGA